MEFGGEKGAASLVEISRVLEETARLVRQHAQAKEAPAGLAAATRTRRETDPCWVRTIMDLRALRHEFLGFQASDAALTMMLELYAARLESRRLHQTALGIAARVPPTTALRVTQKCVETGLFTREPDRANKRLFFLDLSDLAFMRLRAYLATAAHVAPLLA